MEILESAQIDKDKIIVIAITDLATQERVISNSRILNPKIKIICRVHHQQDLLKLKALGIEAVILPEFEASLAVIRQVLQSLDLPNVEIKKQIKLARLEQIKG